ncbi:hypothetical protein GCM10022254_72120 [Actinomadura meridiana]|uniref:Uncharacterized protein n=1 Tax=Actinomadura meridiana TaxID=559626 RepID=A0ABP8CPC9_9ACTN
MGVEQGSGTDARPETGEKSYAPPPDNPGSAGQPSRLESRARARDAQGQGEGKDPAGEAREDKPQAAAGSRESGKDREAGNGEGGTEGGRSEQPAARSQPYRDMPGSPGQPSRLESRARARETQTQGEAGDTSAPASRERDDKPVATPVNGQPREGMSAGAGRAEQPATSQRPGQDMPGSTGQPSRPESIARTREQGQPGETTSDEGRDVQAGGRSGEGGRGEPSGWPYRDMPGQPGQPSRLESRARARETAGQSATPETETGERPEPPARVTDPARPQAEDSGTGELGDGRDGEPVPEQDGQTGTQLDSPTRQTDATEPQAEGGEARDTSEGEGRPQDAPDPINEAGPTRPDRATQPTSDAEQPTPIPDESTDKPSPPDNETSGLPDTRTDGDTSDADRDRNAEDNGTSPEAPANPILSDVRLGDDASVRIEPRYGRERPAETAPALTETPDPARLPARKQLDPAGEQAEPKRGELRDPNDDPMARDLRDRDPEKRTRRSETLDRLTKNVGNMHKVLDEFSKPIDKGMKRVEPTGQHSGSRPDHGSNVPTDQSVKAGDATIGGLGFAIVAVTAIRQGVNFVQGFLRRRHEDNGSAGRRVAGATRR